MLLSYENIGYINTYNIKLIKSYHLYILLLIKFNLYKEFVIYWNKLLNCYKHILGVENMEVLALYDVFGRKFMINLEENEMNIPDDELKDAIKILNDGDRIARNCCGDNHEISKFLHYISQEVYIIVYILIV